MIKVEFESVFKGRVGFVTDLLCIKLSRIDVKKFEFSINEAVDWYVQAFHLDVVQYALTHPTPYQPWTTLYTTNFSTLGDHTPPLYRTAEGGFDSIIVLCGDISNKFAILFRKRIRAQSDWYKHTMR